MEPSSYAPYSDSNDNDSLPVIYNQPSAIPLTSANSSNTNTTVIIQQPQMPPIKPQRLWATGLMDCFDDMGICLCGLFCGCYHSSEIAQNLGESACVPCCVPGGMVALRMKWRTQENISGSLMNDCCTMTYCGPCALCQLAREIKYKKDGVMLFPGQVRQY